jgi:DNA-binding LytR/AlgR family response regulator
VKRSVEWFANNPPPELVFMDIQLADGLSFEIFEHVKVTCPIIFTTAYDEYALKAFKVNSIDYLLKPIDKDDLTGAIDKFHALKKPESNPMDHIVQAIEMLSNKYKNRFLIKTGEHIKSIPTEEVHYFFSRDKASYCSIDEGKIYIGLLT